MTSAPISCRSNGVSNLFLFFEPLHGWRHLEVIHRRTTVDRAHQVRQLVDVHYPAAERIEDVAAWQAERNADATTMQWRFTTARIKIRWL